MRRRQFISQVVCSGATLSTTMACGALSGTLSGCARTRADASSEKPQAVGVAAASEDRASSFALHEWTIEDLSGAMVAGSQTSVSITQAYLDRIEATNAQGPNLRAVIETDPRAIELAAALDAERSAGKVRGPLHGVPVLIKDNIETDGPMMTTAGALALEGLVAGRDADCVRRLRDAGALILGKANLSEMANFRSTRSSSGWSGRGGQCKNPYVLDRTPCGSSSGSGVAVAANLCAVALGTETDGSILCPSATNGIVGIKPTVGLVSRGGIIPLAHSQDTAGPMTRTVADAAIVLGAIAGRDPADTATTVTSRPADVDYLAQLRLDGLAGAKIGVARQFFGRNAEVDTIIEAAIEVMRESGATIVDSVNIPHVDELDKYEFELLLYEFKADLNGYLNALGQRSPRAGLEEIIAFNRTHAAESMPHFNQEILEMAQAKGGLDEPAYLEAKATAQRLAGPEGIDAAMNAAGVDALIAPTGGPAWVVDHINGDHYTGGSSTPAAVSGYPSLTVPAGFVQGLPIGMSLFGRAWSESTLIRFAHAFEAATRHRRAPEFLDTLPADIRG